MADLPLVSPLDRALFLAAQPYFEGLDASIIATLAAYTEERFARPGEWIHHEGDFVREVSFLAEGEVRLMRGGRLLREVSAPGGVGLASVLAELQWSPGVVATKPTVYLSLPTENFTQILEDRFPLLLQVATTLSQQKHEPILPGRSSDLGEGRLDLVERISVARRSPLFASTNLIALIEIMRASEEIRLPTGNRLWCSGSPAQSFALVLEGTLNNRENGKVNQAESGDLIGLDDILNDHGRLATTAAIIPSRVLQIPKSSYFDSLEDHFDSARDLLRYFATRFIESWD